MLILALFFACNPDRDGDGVNNADDCGPDDPTTFPGAREGCDGTDHDCDGAVDPPGAISADGVPVATLDEALGAAEIGLCAGTWPPLVLDHDVVIDGRAGADVTVIDAAGQGAAVVVHDAVVTLSGVTLTGGIGADVDGERQGGGLYALGASVTLHAVIITENTADKGGGIYVGDPGALSLTDSLVRDNDATGNGGGLYVEAFEDVDLSGTTFAHDTAGLVGGGAFVRRAWDAAFVADGAVFDANEAGQGGGLALVSDEAWPASLRDVVFTGNAARQHGGGLRIDRVGAVDLTGATFTDNEASNLGGGFSIDDLAGDIAWAGLTATGNLGRFAGGGMVTLDSAAHLSGDAKFEDNTAVTSGGGLLVSGDAPLTLTGARLVANHASAGGGLQLEVTADVTLEDVTVDGNDASSQGGGVTAYRTGATTVTLTRTAITHNTAVRAAGIALVAKKDARLWLIGDGASAIEDNTAAEDHGGLGTYRIDDDVPPSTRLVGLRIAGNTAAAADGEGGGASVIGQAVEIEDCAFTDNAAGLGAGLMLQPVGPTTIRRTPITGNDATISGGGAYVRLAAQAAPIVLTFEDSPITANSAGTSGGGLMASLYGFGLTLRGAQLTDNQAGSVGGGAYLFNGPLVVEDVEVRNNRLGAGAYLGGGLALRAYGPVSLSRVTIADNDAGAGYGGGLSIEGTTSDPFTLTDVTLAGNHAYAGGGVDQFAAATAFTSTWTDAQITGNTADFGGGATVVGGAMAWSGVSVRDNHAASGSGVYVEDGGSDAQVVGITGTDSEIAANTGVTDGIGGGAVLIGGASLAGVTVRENRAADCGGVVTLSSTDAGPAMLDDVTITGNTAEDEGGGLCVAHATALTDVTLDDNHAAIGGAASIDAPTSWTGGALTRNTSTGGGAVWLTGGALTASGVDFGDGTTDNTPADVAFDGGGRGRAAATR